MEALRQLHLRHVGIVKTERLLTLFTVEMRMLVVIVLMVVTVAQFIAHTLAAALYHMDEVVFLEEREGSENVRLVDA